MDNFLENHKKNIVGVLECFDRIMIKGTMLGHCYAEGMTRYLFSQGIRIFDYPKFASSLRDDIKRNAEKIAQENNIEIQYIQKKGVRKEELVQKIIDKRGNHPGLVHIISVVENCSAFKPWFDHKKKKAYLVGTQGKCLHYYFYYIDEEFGLCFLKVPTWCPFQLKFYCNGHSWLEAQFKKYKLGYKKLDNAFTFVEDCQKAQRLSDSINALKFQKALDRAASKFCPVIKKLKSTIYWSIDQVEYATDIIFKDQKALHPVYDNILKTAIYAIESDDISKFLGKKLHKNFAGEIGSNISNRIEGRRIKHVMKKSSIKMYDKFGKILRIETTSNDISSFKHFRKVEKRNGGIEIKNAPMKKTIYSLGAVLDLFKSSNKRYLQYISAMGDTSEGAKKLGTISMKVTEKNRSYRGFNFFDKNDERLFKVIIGGEFIINGMTNKDIRLKLNGKSTSQISRLLKSLRLHGIIKKVNNCYKYYLTNYGRKMIIAALKIKNLMLIPELSKQFA